MNICFKPGMSEFRNLMDSLYMLYNDNYKKSLDTFNIKPNKAVENALEFLKERVTFNLKYGELFLKEDIFVLPSLASFEDQEKFCGAMDFVDYLKGLKEEEIKLRVLKDLKNDDKIGDEELEALLKDPAKTVEFIGSLSIASSIKWEVFDFFQHVKPSVEELCIFLQDYIPMMLEVLEKNKKIIEDFDRYLVSGIEERGLTFINSVARGAMDFQDVEEVFAASAFFNSHSLSFSHKESCVHIFVGFTFEETAKGIFGEEQIEVNLNMLKNLSDKTRFQILMLLKEKEMYGQEIAEKIGITMATVSYHMSYLLISNLVFIDKVGHKGYYKLNKDTLRQSIEFLNGIFEL